MANSCPDCGSTVQFEEHEVRLRTGKCSSCAKEFAVVEGPSVSSQIGALSPERSGGEPGERESVQVGLECEACGGPLSVRAKGGDSLEVVCEDCDTSAVYVPARAASRPSRGPPARFDPDARPARPCRQCGAPLRFSTDENGNLVGECDACGNRFTLPPRSRSGEGRRDGRYERNDSRGTRRGRGAGRGYERDSGSRPYRGSRPRGERYGADPRRARRRRSDD